MTTAVTCPTVRTHPAIIAQAAATSAVMLDGGFGLGVGTGEALNEHIFGDPWPSIDIRLEIELAGRIGDGYIGTSPDPDLVQRYRDAGGKTKPALGGFKVCGADAGRHLKPARTYLDAGYDEVYVANIGPHVEAFMSLWRDEVLPELRRS